MWDMTGLYIFGSVTHFNQCEGQDDTKPKRSFVISVEVTAWGNHSTGPGAAAANVMGTGRKGRVQPHMHVQRTCMYTGHLTICTHGMQSGRRCSWPAGQLAKQSAI